MYIRLIITLCIFYISYDAVIAVIRVPRQAAIKKDKCLNPPRTARRVMIFIQECQEEVKNKLVSEAFQMLKEEAAKTQKTAVSYDDSLHFTEAQPSNLDDRYQYLIFNGGSTTPNKNERISRLLTHIRRMGNVSSNGIYHPTLVPFEDKRIAGCLLHCVYAKNNAIDNLGWPTLDGLVNFYSEGVNEHGFFMATLRSVNLCLRAVTNKYQIDRRLLPQHGESCDMAFDVFDCISDQITGYCFDQYKN